MRFNKFRKELKKEYEINTCEIKPKRSYSIRKIFKTVLALSLSVFVFALIIDSIAVGIYTDHQKARCQSLIEEVTLSSSSDLTKVNNINEVQKINWGTMNAKKSILSSIFVIRGCGSAQVTDGSMIYEPGTSDDNSYETNNQKKGINEPDIAKCSIDGGFIAYESYEKLNVFDLSGNLVSTLNINMMDKMDYYLYKSKINMQVYNNKIILYNYKMINIYEFSDNKLTQIYSDTYDKLMDSRLKDNYLYLVSSNYKYDEDFKDVDTYYDICSGCSTLYRLIKINLDDMTKEEVDNLNDGYAQLYMDDDYIILATHFYKFLDGVTYQLTLSSVFTTDLKPVGVIRTEGSVLNQYSMNVKDGYFFIVVTKNSAKDNELNRIYSYDLSALELAGKIENNLGKGRENVKSVSYSDDKCFVVTYRNTDPLYEIDITNPHEMVIVDELELPGYSSYMYNFELNGKKYILGIGRTDIITEGKISLFEDGDNSNKELGNLIIAPYNVSGVLTIPGFKPSLLERGYSLNLYNDGESLYLGGAVSYNYYYIFKIDPNAENVVTVYKSYETLDETRMFIINSKILIPNGEEMIIDDFR